jgi:uncharacterized membrane protein
MAATGESIPHSSTRRPPGSDGNGSGEYLESEGRERSFDRWSSGEGVSDEPRIDPYRLNEALGWFSIGLGLVELVAPRGLGRLIGAGDHPTLMRLCGLREIASGVGLLSQRAPATAAASRVAGDVMDIALLGAALRSPDAQPARLALAATTVLGVAAVDAYAAGQHARIALAEAEDAVPVVVSVAINSSPEKLYTFWRDLQNLPRFMSHLESVTPKTQRVSRWVAKAPGGGYVEWDSEVVEDRPNELISWRTLPGSDVRHEGLVSFEPEGNGRGTLLRVELDYAAPGGALGAGIAKLLGEEPELQIKRDLRALKQLLETGEVTTTRGQSSGKRSFLGKALTRREP